MDGVLDLDGLADLAGRVWSQSEPGWVVWLTGELGSGKTAFVQQVCDAAGSGGGSSPTYALLHAYECPDGTILHADCYRLNTPDEARDLDLTAEAAASRLTLIEWPERAGRFAPPADLHLTFVHTDNPDTRRVMVDP